MLQEIYKTNVQNINTKTTEVGFNSHCSKRATMYAKYIQ